MVTRIGEWLKSWRGGRVRAGEGPARRTPGVYAVRDLPGRPAAWRDDPAGQIRQNRHWVYVAVRAIAGRVAGTPLSFRRAGTGEILPWDHPLPRLMRTVNPFETAASLWMKTLTFLELTGNAYWYVPAPKDGGPGDFGGGDGGPSAFGGIDELWVLPSQHMRVIPDRERFVAGYRFQHAGATEDFSPDEIIHLKYPGASSPYYGESPLAAAADSVESHLAMKRAERRSFDHGAFPGLALMTEEKLSPETRERLEAQFRQGYGGPDKAGRAIVLEQGLKLRPFTFSPREMDFLESSRVARDEILAIFGVPPAVAGISEDVNRASAEAMLWTFAENTLWPKLRLIEAQLTQDLCPAFGADIEARFASPVPDVRAEDRADMVARLAHQVTTPAEERVRLGLETADRNRSGQWTAESGQ